MHAIFRRSYGEQRVQIQGHYELKFEAVREAIGSYLEEASYRRAVAQ